MPLKVEIHSLSEGRKAPFVTCDLTSQRKVIQVIVACTTLLCAKRVVKHVYKKQFITLSVFLMVFFLS